MYINKIDEVIDREIDRFYLEILTKKYNKLFSKFIKADDDNFIQDQSKINDLIQTFMTELDVSQLKKLINSEEKVNSVSNIIKRYIAYYVFLTIAFYYNGSQSTFSNNIVEFSKLQELVDIKYKIPNFFNSENNAQIIKFFALIKDIIYLIRLNDAQIKTINKRKYFDSIMFLNQLGKEFIDEHLIQLKNIDKNTTIDTKVAVHNLIKTLVFRDIYIKQEKIDVFKMLNEIEKEEGEYRYIDIVVSKDNVIDYSQFEQMLNLPQTASNKNLIYELYKLITEEATNINVKYLSADDKISKLLESSFLMPITDEFLRYHKDSEKIDEVIDYFNKAKDNKKKKKENTKIHYVINKIENISELYSETVKKNSDLQKELKSKFYVPLLNRKAILYNDHEELKIINKILNLGKRNIESNEYFMDLINYRTYPYINFKDFKKYGFSYNIPNNLHKTLLSLRYSNIETLESNKNESGGKKSNNNDIEFRVGVSDKTVNIVGICIKPFNRAIECLKIKDLINIRTVPWKDIMYGNEISNDEEEIINNEENGFFKLLYYIKNFIINCKAGHSESKTKSPYSLLENNAIYWIFDTEKDTTFLNGDNNNNNENIVNFQSTIKTMLSKLYDDLNIEISNKIIKMIHKKNNMNQYDGINLVKDIDKRILSVSDSNEYDKYYEKIKYLLYYFKNNITDQKQLIDEYNIDKKNMIKLPEYVKPIDISPFKIAVDMTNTFYPTEYVKANILKYKFGVNIKEEKNDETICQHVVIWNNISHTSPDKRKDLAYFNNQLTNFIDKYLIINNESDFVCKSCGEVVNLKNFVMDGSFDNNQQKFVTSYIPFDIELKDIPEYQKYTKLIEKMEFLLDKISSITGVNYFMIPNESTKRRRKKLIKNTIDLVNLQYKRLNKVKRSPSRYGISSDYTNLILFEIDDSILTIDRSILDNLNDRKNALKALQYNNVLIYLLLLFIIEINDSHIKSINFDKLANADFYDRYSAKLFANLQIKRAVNSNELLLLNDIPIFGYILYMFSYLLFKYKLWLYPTNTKANFAIIQKIIVTTAIDALNSIVEVADNVSREMTEFNEFNSKYYIYSMFTSKIYSSIDTLYKKRDILDFLKTFQNKKLSLRTKQDDKKIQINTYNTTNGLNTISLSGKSDATTAELPTFTKIPSRFVFGTLFKDPNLIMKMPLLNVYNQINTLTNCPSGYFHKWIFEGKTLICSNCKYELNEINYEIDYYNKDNRSILENYNYIRLQKLAQKYCNSGDIHIFEQKQSGDKIVDSCKICGKQSDYQYSTDELDKLNDNLLKNENDYVNEANYERKVYFKDLADFDENVQKLYKEKYSKFEKTFTEENKLKFIDILIDNIQQNIGIDTNLGTSKLPIYIKDNVYIVDHQYDGTSLTEPIIIIEKDKKVHFKENHTHFNTDVIYYTDYKSGHIDVYYNAVTLALLGYKKQNKEYVNFIPKGSNKYLHINYSIYHKIKNMGYPSTYIKINDIYQKIKNDNLNLNDSEIIREILNLLSRERIDRLKKIMYIIIRTFNQLKYYKNIQTNFIKQQPKQTYTPNVSKPVSEDVSDNLIPQVNVSRDQSNTSKNINMNDLITKSTKILNKIKLDKIFKHWTFLPLAIYNKDKPNFLVDNLNNMTILNSHVTMYDDSGNFIIYYIVNRLSKLININDDKFIRKNLAMFIIQLINYINQLYNESDYGREHDLKRFKYILFGNEYTIDMERKGHGIQIKNDYDEAQTTGIYEEYITEDELNDKHRLEKLEDDRERADAIDLDGPMDFETDDDDYFENNVVNEWDGGDGTDLL
jgi:hypothetical protein